MEAALQLPLPKTRESSLKPHIKTIGTAILQKKTDVVRGIKELPQQVSEGTERNVYRARKALALQMERSAGIDRIPINAIGPDVVAESIYTSNRNTFTVSDVMGDMGSRVLIPEGMPLEKIRAHFRAQIVKLLPSDALEVPEKQKQDLRHGLQFTIHDLTKLRQVFEPGYKNPHKRYTA